MTATADPRGTDERPGLTLPAPQVRAPGTAPPLRWGVISAGHIADQFTATAHRATASRVVSVVSRSQQRAEAFAAKHGLERAFSSVADMLAAGGIDAVYVASPHAQHHRSEEHTSELQSRGHLVCRLLLEKKKKLCCHLFLYRTLRIIRS